MAKAAKNKKQNMASDVSQGNPAEETAPVMQSISDPEPTVEEINDENDINQALGSITQLDQETLEKAKFLVRQQSRGERKARKAFEGLGLTFVPGITRVAFKRPRNELIVIAKPEVYKANDSDVYIIYGEPTMPNGNLPPQVVAAEQMARQHYASMIQKQETEPVPTLTTETEDDSSLELPPGVEEKDVQLVMDQADISRAQAINAIRKSNGDVVSAIMDVTAS